MLQRKRKSKIKQWAIWTVGALVTILVLLGLIKIDDVVMAQGITEPGQKIYIDSPLTRVVKQIVAEAGDTVLAGEIVVLLYDGDLRAEVAASRQDDGDTHGLNLPSDQGTP